MLAHEADLAARDLAKELARGEITQEQHDQGYDQVKQDFSETLAELNLTADAPERVKDAVFEKAWSQNDYISFYDVERAYEDIADIVKLTILEMR